MSQMQLNVMMVKTQLMVSRMIDKAQDEKLERMERVLEELKPMAKMLQQIVDDRTVPRNIRAAADEALEALARKGPIGLIGPSGPSSSKKEKKEDKNLRISTAISVLDDIINDPNMPMYTRTQIWNIVSMLEQKRSE